MSPIRHETKVIHSAEGDVTVDKTTKHLRTTSKSDLFEETTKVRKTSIVGGLEIIEEDKVITREKVSVSGLGIAGQVGKSIRMSIKCLSNCVEC